MQAPLLIEIGCEEIPARVIAGASSDLRDRIVAVLDQAGFTHGPAAAWGGSRRLAVRVDSLGGRQPDREEQVLGPPAGAAFGPDGSPTPAATGFARKHGVDPSVLQRIETDRGVYSGFRRSVPGRKVGEVLAAGLPPSVAAMSFPKTMRWGDGRWRWVRPVHWVLALHAEEVLPIELFGVKAGGASRGHRFLAPGPVQVAHPDRYREALQTAYVVVEPAERRALLLSKLRAAAASERGQLVEDPALLEEVGDMIEWPGVAAGRFDGAFLGLPREILVTTLRHHQKSFCVESGGRLEPVFLSALNTDRDPRGHVRRGNEWVVTGRLEDARFFWDEDRKMPLAERLPQLKRVVFHQKVGTYAEKADRMERLARNLAVEVGLPPGDQKHAARAAQLAKCDLVTSLVGEFPELQGIAGGLLLREEGTPEAVWQAVYEHYRPTGPDDALPTTDVACVVSVADKLDAATTLLGAGERPTGSRDPYGLRRAANGILRILLERRWQLSVETLWRVDGSETALFPFLQDRLGHFLVERGYTSNETLTVLNTPGTLSDYPIHDLVSRLDALRAIRKRTDFARLVELTHRAENIHKKGNQDLLGALKRTWQPNPGYRESDPIAVHLDELVRRLSTEIEHAAAAHQYEKVVALLSEFVIPVDRFFEKVLVMNPDDLDATQSRLGLLKRLHGVLTRYFDLRELAGEAARRA